MSGLQDYDKVLNHVIKWLKTTNIIVFRSYTWIATKILHSCNQKVAEYNNQV